MARDDGNKSFFDHTSQQIDDAVDAVQYKASAAALQSEVEARQADTATLRNALIAQINGGAKNRMPFKIADIKQQNTNGTWSGNTFTHSTGVTFTVNSDYSITVTGTASGGNAAFVISPNGRFTIENGEWVLSGTPSGGSTTSYNISIAGTASDLGNSVEFTGCTAQFVRIYVISGTTVNNLVFRPMVCSKADWIVSQAYVPYCPTMLELYQMILSQNSGASLMMMSKPHQSGYIDDTDQTDESGGDT